MLHIALFQPEIPQNTGNIIRLSANCGAQLHLIYPMGFAIDDKRAQRAGLDYHELARVQHHPDYEAFQQAVSGQRIIACSTKGKTNHSDFSYQDDDVLLFGPETRGLPTEILTELNDSIVRIPMLPQSRSLNLSNAVAIITYEAWRQLDYII